MTSRRTRRRTPEPSSPGALCFVGRWSAIFEPSRRPRNSDTEIDALVEGAVAAYEATTSTSVFPSVSATTPVASSSERPNARPLFTHEHTGRWVASLREGSRGTGRLFVAAVVLLVCGVAYEARGLLGVRPAVVPVAARKAPSSPPPELGPGVLLRRARSASEARRYRLAARLYRRLLRSYPHAEQSRPARLALARLELETLHDPQRAAHDFAVYLRRHAQDASAAEAAVGRARALEASGRDATPAWDLVRRRYPHSAGDALARARLRRATAKE